MFTLTFWKATLERVFFTAAQVLAALLAVDGFGISDLGASTTWSVVGLAAIAALLKCITAGAVSHGTPSAINAETLVIPDGDGRYRATK